MATKYDNLYAELANVKVCSSLPNSPTEYYGGDLGHEGEPYTWVGGELVYLTTNSKLYLNSATSGTTATWYRLADAFATSTSTTSTSTSTTTSTSSSTTTTTSTSTTTTTTTSTSTTTTTTTSTSTTTSTTTSTSTSTSSTTTGA